MGRHKSGGITGFQHQPPLFPSLTPRRPVRSIRVVSIESIEMVMQALEPVLNSNGVLPAIMCFGVFLFLRAAQRTSEKLILMLEEKNAEIKFKDRQILELAKAARTEGTGCSAPSLHAETHLSNGTTEKHGGAPAPELLERIKEIEGEFTLKDRQLLSLSQAREKLESTIEDLEATVDKLKQELSTSKEAEKHWKEQAWLQASSSGFYKPAVELRKSEERITELEDKLSESHRQINTYRTAVETCRCDSALGGLNVVERQDPEKKLTQTGWVSLPPTLCVFDGPIS